MERTNHRDAKLPEAPASVVLRDQIEIRGIAVSDVHSNREIEPAHFLIERVEIWMGDQPVAFDAAHEDATGTVGGAKFEFLQCCAHVEQRQNSNPSETAARLLVD